MESLRESELLERVRVLEGHARDQKKQLDEYVGYIERRLKKVFEFIEFHNLKIPLKYRKATGEKEPFIHKKFKPAYPRVFNVSEGIEFDELEMPTSPRAYAKAKERMQAYAQEKDKITQEYFELVDVNGSIVKEVLTRDEANQWVKEGQKEYYLYDADNNLTRNPSKEDAEKWEDLDKGRFYFDIDLRSFYTRFRQVFKPGFSAASSTPSASRDSHQADKPNESSPSSQESPDHKNPPSQT